MDFLSNDLIINTVARVASHSVHDLFHFIRTNKRHADLCRSHDVSRDFGDDCTELLTDLCLTTEKLNFINRLWDVGNPMFWILRCTHHMLHPKPHFGKINRLLTNTIDAKSFTCEFIELCHM